MICKTCNATIPDGVKFCPRCGATSQEQATQQAAVIVCPQCGAKNQATAKFCKADGYSLAQVAAAGPERVREAMKDVRICPSCGTENPSSAKFCRKDGTRLEDTGRAPAPRLGDGPDAIARTMAGAPQSPAQSAEDKARPEIGNPMPEPEEAENITPAPDETLEIPAQEKIETAVIAVSSPEPPPDPEKPDPPPDPEPQAVSTMEKPQAPEPVAPTTERPNIDAERPPKEGQTVNRTNVVLCPVCGTEHGTESRFCRKDGTPLRAAETPGVKKQTVEQYVAGIGHTTGDVPPVHVGPELTRKRSKVWLWLIVIIIILAGGTGGYLYYRGYIGKTPAHVANALNKSLSLKGLNITAAVDKDWNATLTGTVNKGEEKDAALGIAKAHSDVRNVIDGIQVKYPFDQLEKMIQDELGKAGLVEVSIRLDQNYTATLAGLVLNQEERERAVSLVRGHKDVKDVVDNTQIKTQPGVPAPADTSSGAPPPSAKPIEPRPQYSARPAPPPPTVPPPTVPPAQNQPPSRVSVVRKVEGKDVWAIVYYPEASRGQNQSWIGLPPNSIPPGTYWVLCDSANMLGRVDNQKEFKVLAKQVVEVQSSIDFRSAPGAREEKVVIKIMPAIKKTGPSQDKVT